MKSIMNTVLLKSKLRKIKPKKQFCKTSVKEYELGTFLWVLFLCVVYISHFIFFKLWFVYFFSCLLSFLFWGVRVSLCSSG